VRAIARGDGPPAVLRFSYGYLKCLLASPPLVLRRFPSVPGLAFDAEWDNISLP
jgi:hypothetical protein